MGIERLFAFGNKWRYHPTMAMRRGRRYDQLRVAVAKIDGIGRRLEVVASRYGVSAELTSVRHELERAQARRWALVAASLAAGVPPSRIADRANVDEGQVAELAEALRRARLGLG